MAGDSKSKKKAEGAKDGTIQVIPADIVSIPIERIPGHRWLGIGLFYDYQYNKKEDKE